MKKSLNLDKKYRIKFMEKEIYNSVCKSLDVNRYMEFRLKSVNEYNKIKNRCVKTGRSAGINRKFGLYRLEIIKMLKNGNLEGLLKIYR